MIGVRADGSIIFMSVDGSNQINVTEGASILYDMGAINVLNLDGGGSTQFFYDGNMKISTTRPIGSVLKVHGR